MMYATLLLMTLVSETLTVSPIGITAHGVAPGDSHMIKNKIDDGGILALNPMLSAMYRTNKWQFNGAYLQDCFKKNAGYLAAGPYWKFGKYFTLGSIVGVYARERAPNTQYLENPNSMEKSYKKVAQTKLPLSLRSSTIEVALMPMVTASAELPITDKAGIEFNLGTNGALTNLQMGFKWNFGGRQ